MSRGGKKQKTLTGELSALLVKTLVPDLAGRAKAPAVRTALERRHAHEKAASRTAEGFDAWQAQLLEQVGAAWVLSCVFVRTLEDRGLLAQRRLAGEGAHDSEELFFKLAPGLTSRDYLLMVFKELSRLPGAEDLLGPKHNPAWRLSPSHEGARKLLEFFRATNADGTLVWTFGGSDTRFLGDLYQDFSELARKRYALLQTPRFVERFILDETLEPAIKEFGLEGLRVIDPTCGSGHFLLGAFERLFDHHQRAAPGDDPKAIALRAMTQVYGVDLNPNVVAIARFRLTLAFLEKAGLNRLAKAPKVPFNLVVADSLLYGGTQQGRLSELSEDVKQWGDELFDLEDAAEAQRVFRQGYHAVVGNPPYITCKDSALRDEYRRRYESCYREFALAAPFTERFFQLAVPSGFIGLINSNSFMKREFGSRLIEVVLKRFELTRVVDSSGAFIPGHGTPTIMVFGRNQPSALTNVPAVLGKRGEPTTPTDPEQACVWLSIATHYREIGFENEYVSVASIPRDVLSKHPWSLGGGGASELKSFLESHAGGRLSEQIGEVGFGAVTREDDLYMMGKGPLSRTKVDRKHLLPMVTGDCIRDWSIQDAVLSLWPYDPETLSPVAGSRLPAIERTLWPYRVQLGHRVAFGQTHLARGLKWFEYSMFFVKRFRQPASIAFAFVATHNHFVLDRGGKVFNRSAPVIKLPEGSSEDEHLRLLGYLNSSTAGFLLRQSGHSKGSQGVNEGLKAEAWEQFLEYSGGLVSDLPVPGDLTRIGEVARRIDALARSIESLLPAARLACTDRQLPLGDDLAHAATEVERISARMVGLQEELDWLVYEAFGLLTPEDLKLLDKARGEALPNFPRSVDDGPDSVGRAGLYAGHRAFEVVLARDCLVKGTKTAWFERNGYRSPSEITQTYSPAYQRLLEARIAVIDRNPHIRLIEQPEYKRRWTRRDVAEETRSAARAFLADALERASAAAVAIRPARDLAREALQDARTREVAELLFGRELDLANAVADLVADDAVPFVSVQRFSEAGRAKHALWLKTWELQRREDAGEKVSIDVPPRYDSKDYTGPTAWRLRGKLDVPHERFIAYPGSAPDGEAALHGWAGWDHLQRATALAQLFQERKTRDGWTSQLTPLLAGLLELVPWLEQWHNEPNADFDGERLGDYYAQFVEAEARALGLSLDDLRAWRPVKRGRKAAAPPTSTADAAPKPRRNKKTAEPPAEDA